MEANSARLHAILLGPYDPAIDGRSYVGEVIGNLETIERNVPEGGTYELLPEHTPEAITAIMFPNQVGFVLPPSE